MVALIQIVCVLDVVFLYQSYDFQSNVSPSFSFSLMYYLYYCYFLVVSGKEIAERLHLRTFHCLHMYVCLWFLRMAGS